MFPISQNKKQLYEKLIKKKYNQDLEVKLIIMLEKYRYRIR